MNKKSIPPVGIIAEDDSDVDCVRIFVQRISGYDNIKTYKFTGKGCGRIQRKCHAWAKQLKIKGCTTLILIHDLDTQILLELKNKIINNLNPCPIVNHLICIPVQELEAWFLSDPDAIKSSMNLRKVPRVDGLPERINSPKEYLGKIIYNASIGEKIYVNTKHNVKMANSISIERVKNICKSFLPFYDFIQTYI